MTIKITNGSILLEIAGNTNQNNKTKIYFEIHNITGLNQVILAYINCVPTKKVTPCMYEKYIHIINDDTIHPS